MSTRLARPVRRFATWNTEDLYMHDTTEERDRHAGIEAAIRAMDVDVIAIQELCPTGRDTAVHLPNAQRIAAVTENLDRLAAATGLCCRFNGRPAVAMSRIRAVAVLWNPDVEVIDLAISYFEDFWNGCVLITVRSRDRNGNVRIRRYGSTQADPWSPKTRANEAPLLTAMAARGRTRPPTKFGADLNNLSAARRPDGAYYDDDPFVKQTTWYPDLVYQCSWSRDDQGRICDWYADRSPTELLDAGGLRDAAAVLNADWQPTTGHGPNDPFPPRRIDQIYSTDDAVDDLADLTVLTDRRIQVLSDHRPVIANLR